MVKKSHGPKIKTRMKLKKSPSYRPAITRYLQDFEVGQTVAIEHDSTSQKGMPYLKFKGFTGKVVSKRGGSYVVEIRVGDSKKLVISRPEHLKAIR